MSRKKNFLRGFASSYLALGANIAYTILSVPLALSYLSKDEFALWALLIQVSSFAMLIDLGMSNSASRILIDHKDDKTNGTYGSLLQTSILVAAVQGGIVALLGIAISPWIGTLLSIPQPFTQSFSLLFGGNALLVGLGFVARSIAAPLYAHQRFDISNLAQATQFVVMLGGLWWGLHAQMGIYSVLVSGTAGVLWLFVIQTWAAWKLNMYPERGHWSRPRKSSFLELFHFGKDVFLMGLGAQLVIASPLIIIARLLGLDAAASWAIGTKVFILAQQLVGKIFDFTVAGFSEMLVRGEMESLRSRFRDTIILTGAVAVYVGVPAAFLNQDFIQIWTLDKISWNSADNYWMATFLILHMVSRCHGGFLGVSKEIAMGRYIYFFNGLLVVILSLLLGREWGITGVIASLIIADQLPAIYGLYRSRSFFSVPIREMTLGWLKPSFLFLLVFTLVGFLTMTTLEPLPVNLRFWLGGTMLAIIGMPLLFFVGLPRSLREEIRRLISRKSA